LFAPGSFVLVVPVAGAQSYISEDQSQCALVQVTGEIEAGGGSTSWSLPIGDSSQFNANLEVLLNAGLGNPAVPNDANLAAVTGKNGSRFGADWDPETAPAFELI